MKKTKKSKLALGRETMRHLQSSQLARAAGGYPPVDSHGLCTSFLCGMWTRNDCDGTIINCPTSGCP